MEQRVIKFRAWEERTKTMHYNLSWYSDNSSAVMSKERPLIGARLLQFTGLKDKAGVEIYEGDLISFDHRFTYVVKYEDAKFVCYHAMNDYGKWGDLHRLSDPDFMEYHHEVIGNIFTHPHLIKQ